MAAYAALISLSQTLHQILHPPPLHLLIIPRQEIESLQEKVSFLIDFLETYSSRRSKEIEDLEVRIADAAYSAEDIIESTVVSQIHGSIRQKAFRPTGRDFGQMIYVKLMRRMVKKFHSIEKELMKIKDKKCVEDLQRQNSITVTSARPLPGGKITMVGFDKRVDEIMRALAADESSRQIIPIVGMGGIGKTTLASAVYNNPFIVEYFHVRAWVTVSQEYNVNELLVHLLSEINKACPDKQKSTNDEPGLQLHKKLFDRKYLIVMDDMWNVEACEKLKIFLPDNRNGSRILVTSRVSNLTVDFESCTPYQMDFLDEGQSWDLLCNKIFAEENCPVELEEVGKDIAKRCRGLPLALVVIGGLLGKSERTREHWESVAGDVSSALNYGNDVQVMKILSLSYIHLPVHLKPGFLYLAMFPEDSEIRVPTLVRLWIAEGLIKQTRAKTLEEVAYEYLEDLISRNLILVDKKGSRGKVKFCKIHDLVRDFCIIEAEKEKFVYTARADNLSISPILVTKRRLSIYPSKQPLEKVSIKAMQSSNFNRSWLCYYRLRGFGQVNHTRRFISDADDISEVSHEWYLVSQIIHGFRLLKVAHVNDNKIHIDIVNLINLRYVAAWSVSSISSMSLCWNLQTLVVPDDDITLPAEFWQMPQLRHLKIRAITLPDPQGEQDVIVLENLQTLAIIENFRCAKQVLERIPNLKKLKIKYYTGPSTACEQVGSYCSNNLARLHKLESLGIEGGRDEEVWRDIAFPKSLKKLTLENCGIPWEDLSIVGSLPNLEVLKLYAKATKGEEWNPIEGDFCRLKFLLIMGSELEIWGAENYHFPSLERLVLKRVTKLKEIPISFAEIITLEAIELYARYGTLCRSAKEISDERELLGYEPLQLPRS